MRHVMVATEMPSGSNLPARGMSAIIVDDADSGGRAARHFVIESIRPYVEPESEHLYEKCRDCHLFVEPNSAWKIDSKTAPYVHLARGNAPDEKLDADHEPIPSGMKANLATWKVFGPVLMRERFVNPTEWTDY